MVEVYNYLPSHIYCLVSDGTNPAEDRHLLDGSYDSSPLDFNEDGINDIQYDATINSLNTVFDELATILTTEDNLFIFSTDHGGPVQNDVVMYLWGESITATQFSNIVNRVNAGYISFVMEQCNSGGFVPKLCNSNRTIATACKYNEPSWARLPNATYNEFVYHWISAVGGITPEGTFVNADFNNDNQISFNEAFIYARTHDQANETPQYCTSGVPDGDEIGLNGKISRIDLIVRDKEEDTGEEPSPGLPFWSSPDIWLTDHNFRKIQPYDLHKYSSCYIAVRVKNIGTEKSKGTEKLHVHWSRSSLRSRWKVSWFESLHLLADLMGAPKGAEVTPAVGINIPSLQPNEEVTLYVLWNLPSQLINPKSVSLSWGFALLAGLDDGLEISGKNEDFLFTENFAKGSNNIAIGNGSLYIIGKGYKQVSELGYMDKPFVVGFDQIAVASHYRLGDFAEVYALLSPDLMRNLNKDKSKGIAVIDESSVLLQSPEAELHFNAFDDKEGLYYVGAKVHFISDKMPDRNEFNFDLTLKTESDPKETLRFTAIRDESVFFKADADVDKKKVVKAREEVSLSSNTIADNAEYVWFDGKGTKIGEGSQISTTPDRSQKYKVSITKEDDGYRSYDEVEVIAVDGVINSISPNPARDNAVVSYKLSDNAFGVSLHISNIQNTLSVAYPLDTNATEKDISLSGFSAGTYIVKLVVGGTVVDSQNLIVY